jgi:hypothetical protein
VSNIFSLEEPLRARFATCENCKEEFDVTENYSEACQYHPGGMERDDSWFIDCDDWPENDDFDREEYPEGHIWTCCDSRGNEVGCEISRHEER